MPLAYLGLGTNLGDREANLREALRRLAQVIDSIAVSSVYRSEPVGVRDQPDFWNLAVRGATDLSPAALLSETRRIERELGRERPFPKAPRVIDIDLLLYDDVVLSAPELELPHPRLLERGFVLRPLVELDPALRHPRTGDRLAERLACAIGLEETTLLFPGSMLLPAPEPP